MQPLPFSAVRAELVFGAALVVFTVLQVISGLGTVRGGLFRRGSKNRFDRGSLLVVVLASAVGLFAGVLASERVLGATIASGDLPIRYAVFSVGIAAVFAGSALRQWAVATLGRSFTLDVRVTSDQDVITAGPYRWVRHPSYTGLLLAYAGFGLALGNWLSVVVLVIVPAAGLVWRIHVEETALVAQLGAPYVTYSGPLTSALFPASGSEETGVEPLA